MEVKNATEKDALVLLKDYSLNVRFPNVLNLIFNRFLQLRKHLKTLHLIQCNNKYTNTFMERFFSSKLQT